MANLAKFKKGNQGVTYLDYTVQKSQLQPLVTKVQILTSCPLPTTKKQVQWSLGLAGYFRQFAPEFTMIAAPLMDLVKDGRPKMLSGQKPVLQRLES